MAVGKFTPFALVVSVATAVILLAILGGRRIIRGAKRTPTGVGAVSRALLFLTSGRTPTPPPASQIELDMAGRKDREGPRGIAEPEGAVLSDLPAGVGRR